MRPFICEAATVGSHYRASLVHLRRIDGDEEVDLDDLEMARVQRYLREKFGNNKITLRDRTQADGSVEVSLDDEFIGVIYRDDEDGDVSYDLNMAILEIDLPEPGSK